MKILIIVPRFAETKGVNFQYAFPLGLAYISSTLRNAGHNISCLNLNHLSGTTEELVQNILGARGKYDYVLCGGLSISFNQIKKVVDVIHKCEPRPGIILGGGLISSEPELMFNVLRPDYIVIGEGEKTIVDLLECLGEKGDIKQIAGIGYQDSEGKFTFNQPQVPIKDIDLLPWPDFEAFGYEEYLDNMHPDDSVGYELFDCPRIYPIICSRSCPFLCTFCFHPIGNRYRQRSLDSIFQELEVMVKRYKINIIGIYDELFTRNRKWLSEFCQRMENFLKDLPWECKWGCQMRVDDVDDEVLKMMKRAGCHSISYGFESYSPAVLKSMKKHITPDQIDRAIKATLKNKISMQGNFIFGDVAETMETAKETLDYFRQNYQAGIFLGFINPYPGTEIYQRCLERGVIKNKLDFIENHIFDVFNMTETMTDKQFRKLWFDVFYASYKHRAYARCCSLTRTKRGTFDIRLKCPHCNEVIEYKNLLLPSTSYFRMFLYCRNCSRRFYYASGMSRFLVDILLFLNLILPGSVYYITNSIKPFVKKLLSMRRRLFDMVKNDDNRHLTCRATNEGRK